MAADKFPTLTPYLVVSSADEAIAFYTKALGAVVRGPIERTEDGRVLNVQLEIGDSILMLNDAFPEYGSAAPKPGDSVFITIHIASTNIQADWDRAVAAGVEVTMPLDDMFWGDRYGQFRDPFGYKWSIGQPIDTIPAS
ncbi:MAG: VOC family protein [Fimbriimonas sp.]